MKNFILNHRSKITFFILCSINLLFVFSNQIQALLITLFSTILFFLYLPSIKKINIKDLFQLILFATPFLFVFIELVRTPYEHWDILKSFYEIRYFCLFIPLVFLLLNKENSNISLNIFYPLFFSQFIIALFILVTSNWTDFVQSANINVFQFKFRTHAEHMSGIHPTYFSFYLCFVIMLLVQYKWQLLKWFQYLLLAFFIIILLLVSSKIAILACVLVLLYQFFTNEKINKKSILISVGIFVFMICASLLLNSRWTELISSNSNELNSVAIRKVIYNTDMSLLKEHWLIGLGTVNLKVLMTVLFYQYSIMLNYPIGFYNTHNQYLEIWLKHGLLGLAYLIVVFTLFVKNKYYQKNKPFFLFILIAAIFMTTENILDRQQGFLFFFFYASLLINVTFYAEDSELKNNLINNNI